MRINLQAQSTTKLRPDPEKIYAINPESNNQRAIEVNVATVNAKIRLQSMSPHRKNRGDVTTAYPGSDGPPSEINSQHYGVP